MLDKVAAGPLLPPHPPNPPNLVIRSPRARCNIAHIDGGEHLPNFTVLVLV